MPSVRLWPSLWLCPGASSPTAVAGITDRQPLAAARRDMCQLAADDVGPASRVDAVHAMVQRPPVAVRPQLERIQQVLDELQRREQVGLDEVDLACSLNRDGELDGNVARRVEPGATADLRHAAMRACLGSTEAQRRALETLGRHCLSDRTILDELTKLFVRTPSPEVQAAVAGILIRADRRSLDLPTLLELVRRHRPDGPERPPIIDALVQRLQEP